MRRMVFLMVSLFLAGVLCAETFESKVYRLNELPTGIVIDSELVKIPAPCYPESVYEIEVDSTMSTKYDYSNDIVQVEVGIPAGTPGLLHSDILMKKLKEIALTKKCNYISQVIVERGKDNSIITIGAICGYRLQYAKLYIAKINEIVKTLDASAYAQKVIGDDDAKEIASFKKREKVVRRDFPGAYEEYKTIYADYRSYIEKYTALIGDKTKDAYDSPKLVP